MVIHYIDVVSVTDVLSVSFSLLIFPGFQAGRTAPGFYFPKCIVEATVSRN